MNKAASFTALSAAADLSMAFRLFALAARGAFQTFGMRLLPTSIRPFTMNSVMSGRLAKETERGLTELSAPAREKSTQHWLASACGLASRHSPRCRQRHD